MKYKTKEGKKKKKTLGICTINHSLITFVSINQINIYFQLLPTMLLSVLATTSIIKVFYEKLGAYALKNFKNS